MGEVISLDAARAQRARPKKTSIEMYDFALQIQTGELSPDGRPAWADDIVTLCLYARKVKAEHEAESCRIRFETRTRGLKHWNEAEDIQARVDANNLDWQLYIALCVEIAERPAETQSHARIKRDTIGRGWLGKGDSSLSFIGRLRAGCLADDHLFPPSLRMERAYKGEARVS